MGEKASSFVDSIRKALNEASEGGGMPDEMLFVPKDGQKRVRFFNEFDPPGAKIVMHDKWKVLKPQPCLKQYGESCPFHNESEFRTRTQYAWTVWDYEAKAKRIGLWAATLQSPVEPLMDIYDLLNTIKDRDYELSRVGEGKKSRWKVKPLSQVATPFEGTLDQPYSEEAIMKIVYGLVKAKAMEELKKEE